MTNLQLALIREWLAVFVRLQMMEMNLLHGKVGDTQELERRLFDQLCKAIREDRL